MNPQMKKGVLEMCILKLLSKEDLYGYDILKKMNCYFPEINESTFYAILRRLHKDGCTNSYYKEPTLGPKRKYYKLTDEGMKVLQKHIKDWNELRHVVSDLGI